MLNGVNVEEMHLDFKMLDRLITRTVKHFNGLEKHLNITCTPVMRLIPLTLNGRVLQLGRTTGHLQG